MLDKSGTVLYVGKAKNLKKRVTSYFKRQLDAKTLSLVAQIESIEVTLTRNEREALLLESNLIKTQKPRYNVVFRDDKSYPYLKMTLQDAFPRLQLTRGSQREPGCRYYGPYPSARAAREALSLLQNIFKLRQCDPAFFKNRSRPCLQYQIKRCSAPCVGYISEDIYKKDVEMAGLFLEGKNKAVIKTLIEKMEVASANLEFEQAASIRDQIALLRSVQEQQIITGDGQDTDILGIAILQDKACIHLLVMREGRMVGSRQYFLNINAFMDFGEEVDITHNLLKSFILQQYAVLPTSNVDVCAMQPRCKESKTTRARVAKSNVATQMHGVPKTLLLPYTLEEEEDISSILTDRFGFAVQVCKASRGDRLRWVQMAMANANAALKAQAPLAIAFSERLQSLQEALGLELMPERLECFDVSHTLGEATVVSCVVFDPQGPLKSDYRKFNIRSNTGGDDYAALKEGLSRHYTRVKAEGSLLPEILIIDGGKGQLSVAESVLHELQIVDVVLLAVAKGPERRPGLETVYWSSEGKVVSLSLASPALLLIQQVRDEAHRFAITAHRKLRAAGRKISALAKVDGIGRKRQVKLLQYFGSLAAMQDATLEELAKVPGISQALAERLFKVLHEH